MLFLLTLLSTDSVAQLVEQYTFNVWVLGSNPSGITKADHNWSAFLILAYLIFFIMAWVYFLYSKKINKYYVGACTDLDRRLYEYNLGHSKFTSTGTPWELVFKEEWEDLALAKQREMKIKKMKSRTYIQDLIQKGNL